MNRRKGAELNTTFVVPTETITVATDTIKVCIEKFEVSLSFIPSLLRSSDCVKTQA